MQTAKNWCDGERVKKLGILRVSKQGLAKNFLQWRRHEDRSKPVNKKKLIRKCLLTQFGKQRNMFFTNVGENIVYVSKLKIKVNVWEK